MEVMNGAQLRDVIATLPDWWLADDDAAIQRELEFADFTTAFAFMTAVAIEAQVLNHHPDWSNSYRTVSISLSTHVAGGVTATDIELARRIDRHAGGPLTTA